MSKLFIIARSNMRKAKGQTVAIVTLILLASMLLNLWLMLSMRSEEHTSELQSN